MVPTPWASLVELADRGATFHITDTETTGLSAGTNRVIELATVSVRDGRIVDRFETFINPGVRVPARITEITGIRDAMLAGAPTPESAFRAWQAYLGRGGHFVAHNARFDWDFLHAEFGRAALDWPFQQSICTVRLARHCLPRLPRHGLDALIAHYGIVVGDRHRALADVEATADIFLRLLDRLRGAPEEAIDRPGPVGKTVTIKRPPAAAPAPTGPRGPESSRVPASAVDGWDALIAFVRARSNPTAALLAQHASLARREADGAIVIHLTPIYKDRLDQEPRKRELVEAGAQAVYGAEVHVRLEARPDRQD
jgi:DNA polymerase III epsilon subunit family exonuclease